MDAGSLARDAQTVGAVTLVVAQLDDVAMDELLVVSDQIKGALGPSGVIVLGSSHDGKAVLVATVAKDAVDAKRKDHAFLAGGLSVALCALAVNALNYRLMNHLGATGVSAGLDRVLTALAAAGGTKALHELIGRFEKAKDSDEEK